MLSSVLGIWKECFNHTCLLCVRTNLIYFKKSSPRQPFLFVSLGGGEKIEKNSSKLWFDQLAEERLSLKDMKGLIILILFLLKFIITSAPPPPCPGRTKGGNINIQKPPSIWLIKNSSGWCPEERKWLHCWGQ